jgi:hypothetical protein
MKEKGKRSHILCKKGQKKRDHKKRRTCICYFIITYSPNDLYEMSLLS